MDPVSLLALTLIDGIGPVAARNLIAYFGSPEAVFQAPRGKLLKVPGIGPKSADSIKKAENQKRAEAEVLFCEKSGIRMLMYLAPDYPESLKSLFEAPLVLFSKGNYALDSLPQVAIVGTRKPTEYGRNIAVEFSEYLAGRGINIVSGLAFGIDIEAHRAALFCGGTTTAVLGHGLDRIYPSQHRSAAVQIIKSGALVTEFLSGTIPDPGNFPARNRIISGLSQIVVVIEAGETGGALITARFAFEQGKEVFALPGDVGKASAEGCNRIIRDGIAKLVTHPSEIAEELSLRLESEIIKAPVPQIVLSNEERKIYEALADGDMAIDTIGEKTGIAMGSLLGLLLGMEFKGAVRQMVGKRYGRV